MTVHFESIFQCQKSLTVTQTVGGYSMPAEVEYSVYSTSAEYRCPQSFANDCANLQSFETYSYNERGKWAQNPWKGKLHILTVYALCVSNLLTSLWKHINNKGKKHPPGKTVHNCEQNH